MSDHGHPALNGNRPNVRMIAAAPLHGPPAPAAPSKRFYVTRCWREWYFGLSFVYGLKVRLGPLELWLLPRRAR